MNAFNQKKPSKFSNDTHTNARARILTACLPSVLSWALTSLHSDVRERSRLTPAGANVHECLLLWPKSSPSLSLVMLLLLVELGLLGLCLSSLSLKSWLSHSVSLDEALEGLSSRCWDQRKCYIQQIGQSTGCTVLSDFLIIICPQTYRLFKFFYHLYLKWNYRLPPPPLNKGLNKTATETLHARVYTHMDLHPGSLSYTHTHTVSMTRWAALQPAHDVLAAYLISSFSDEPLSLPPLQSPGK